MSAREKERKSARGSGAVPRTSSSGEKGLKKKSSAKEKKADLSEVSAPVIPEKPKEVKEEFPDDTAAPPIPKKKSSVKEKAKEKKVEPVVETVEVPEIKTPINDEKEELVGGEEEAASMSMMDKMKAQIMNIKPMYWGMYACFIIVGIFFAVYIELADVQREWHLLNGYGAICLILAVGDGSPREFFRPIDETNTENRKCFAFGLITMTSFVSWVMAKSIQNSSKLGSRYGLIGGLAYASWFIGVFTTGVIVYYLRKQGYYSLPDFINDRYGPLACVVFALTVLYRLFNEVWSNTVVIADFFGDSLSFDWKLAAWVSMGIPAAYTLIGGMRASLYSDALQALLMCVLLIMTYFRINSDINDNDQLQEFLKDTGNSDSLWAYNPVQGRERWSLEGGLDLLYTGLLQGALSYTFMDPALTDRAFLASKEVMILGFAVGSLLAMAYITVFGFIGVYGNMLGECVEAGTCSESDLHGADMASVSAGEPSAVGTALGGSYYTMLCLVIITSALSTLDSTFSAVAKVSGPDLHGYLSNGKPINPSLATDRDVLIGRIAIAVIGITGTLPLLLDPDELDATTVTGTMVPGLGPPIYMAAFACLFGARFSGRVTTRTRPMLFLLPFLFSASLGTVYQMASQDENCTPTKVMNCVVPEWSNSTVTACAEYETYFSCRFDAGCWRNEDSLECARIESELTEYKGDTCELPCKQSRNSRKERFLTIVDLNGFNVGGGTYKNLLGVNLVSAIGALFLFLFACSDDLLTEKFNAIKDKVLLTNGDDGNVQSEKNEKEAETSL